MENRYKKAERNIDLDRLRDFIRQHGETVYYQKGEWFERDGEPARWFAFVEKGYFKYVAQSATNRRERIAWFSCEKEYVGAYPAVLDGRPTQFVIEALTPCYVVRISGEQLKQFFFQNFETLQLGFLITAHILEQFQVRSISLLNTTPFERYKLLLQRCPGITNELPLGALASYLGISQKTLSVLRSKFKNGVNLPPPFYLGKKMTHRQPFFQY